MRKILITGSSGFIGQELVKNLKLKKNIILYLIINRNKILENSKYVKNIHCSLLNKSKLKKKLKSIDITDVIHCAWLGVDAKKRNSNNQKKNVKIVNNVFEALNKSKINSFIGIGSQAEYGPKENTIKETFKLKPITTYGKIKVKVYNILKNNCKNKKIRFVWLRLFSGYGPGSTMKWIIPNTIQSLISNKKIKFTAGEQVYNFVYVSDIVSAIIKSLLNNKASGAYNLAHKKSYKIKYVVKLIYLTLGINKNPKFGSIEYRKDQIMNFVPSISKIKKDLNWQPKIGIKEGLKKNIKFLKKINKVS